MTACPGYERSVPPERRFTDAELRAMLGPSAAAGIARYVRAGVCQCCGDEGELQPCGHVACWRCVGLGHECVACALAV